MTNIMSDGLHHSCTKWQQHEAVLNKMVYTTEQHRFSAKTFYHNANVTEVQ